MEEKIQRFKNLGPERKVILHSRMSEHKEGSNLFQLLGRKSATTKAMQNNLI